MSKRLFTLLVVISAFVLTVSVGAVMFNAFDIHLQRHNSSILDYQYTNEMLNLWHGEIVSYRRLYRQFFNREGRRALIHGGIVISQ